MTGIVIKDSAASFRDKALGWVGCPISTAGLEFAHFFGGTLQQSLRNFAPGKKNSTAIGQPTINPNSVSLAGGSAFIQTRMEDANSISLIAVASSLNGGEAFLLSNFESASPVASRRAMMYTQPKSGAAGQMETYGQRATDGANANISLAATTSVGTPACTMLRHDNALDLTYLDNLTAGEMKTQAATGTPNLGGRLRIGSAYQPSGYVGTTEFYAAFGFSRSVSNDEKVELYEWIKAYCARRGIAV